MMLDGQKNTDLDAFSLAKLIFALVGMVVVVDYLSDLTTKFVLWKHSAATSAAAVPYLYLILILFPTLSCVVIVFLYRPFALVFGPIRHETERRNNLLRHILYGIGGGLVALVLSIPFLLRGDANGRLVAGAVSNITSLNGLPMFLLLMIALPVAMEATFRGIAFRTLAIHASVPSAVVASSLLFAHLWPAFGWPIGLILGVVSALLYNWTNSLVSPIFANVVLTLSGGAFIVYRALVR
jgi:membrane protease YdiL (CAAX protease family)